MAPKNSFVLLEGVRGGKELIHEKDKLCGVDMYACLTWWMDGNLVDTMEEAKAKVEGLEIKIFPKAVRGDWVYYSTVGNGFKISSSFDEKSNVKFWKGASIQGVFRRTVMNREIKDYIHPWTVTNTSRQCVERPGFSDVSVRYFGITQFFFTAMLCKRERSFAVVKWFSTSSADLGKTYPPTIDFKFMDDEIIPVTQVDSRVLLVPQHNKVHIISTCF